MANDWVSDWELQPGGDGRDVTSHVEGRRELERRDHLRVARSGAGAGAIASAAATRPSLGASS